MTTAALQRAPHARPPFTLSQLKKAIPPHCFKSSLTRSMSYLVYDLAIATALYYIATTFITSLPPPLAALAWPAYWFLQGSVLAGVWVIAHECGHYAFSNYHWLDDTVGFIIHSCLLTPYFSFKYSHRHHHSGTSSLDNDEVFIPKRKSNIGPSSSYHTVIWLSSIPIGRTLIIMVALILGMPLYLAMNGTGRSYDRFASHYDPYSPIFSDRERAHVLLSDAGILTVCYALYRLAAIRGLAWVVLVYLGPVMMVNALVVLVTFLQHNHPSLPRYDSSEWEWLRGTLSTVDRDYGILNKVFHNGPNTHIAHHLFPSIPYYHAEEATEALKPVLGEYYNFDPTPFWKAIFREIKECVYVEPDEGSRDKGVFWYKNSDTMINKNE